MLCLYHFAGSFVIRGLEIGEQDLNLALSCDQLTGIRASQTVNVITGIPTMSLLSEDDELAINDVDFKVMRDIFFEYCKLRGINPPCVLLLP